MRLLAHPCVFAAVTLLACTTSARAERPEDNYWLRIEGYYAKAESTARVDATNGQTGTVIDFEKDLGLGETKTTAAFLLGARFFDNWRTEFEYYELKRNSSRVIDREISWGDTVYPISARLDASFDSTIYRWSTGYSFIKSTEAELGASLGLHVTSFGLALSGSTGEGGALQTERREQTVPLPTLGLYGTYAFSPEISMNGRADVLYLSYNEYSGRLLNFNLGVDWRFTKNFGVGVGYRFVDYQLDITRNSWHGEVNYKFSGPTVYLNAAF